jgi:hypothetical protein
MDGGVVHAACMGEMRNAYKILFGKPLSKRPLWKCRLRWKGNIKIDLIVMGYEDAKWVNLAQDKIWWWVVVNTRRTVPHRDSRKHV